MKRAAIVLICLLAGCASPPTKAEVVVVQCEPRGGSADCVTYVQTPDGFRHSRLGHWGEVGDTFNIITRQGRWSR